LRAQKVWNSNEVELPEILLDKSLELLKSRIRKSPDISVTFRSFFTEEFEYDKNAVARFLQDFRLKDLVQNLYLEYQDDREFTLESTEKILRNTAENAAVKAGLLINALRVGLTGQGVAPGLFDVMQALGRDRTLKRIKRLTEYLSQ
jgi:glutamyl/glutaminyl-tRNA synthetase